MENIEEIVIKYLSKARDLGRVIETRKLEYKEQYKLKESGKTIKAVRAELIRDVISIANSAPDPEEKTGYLFMGIKTDGQIVDNYCSPVNDPADFDGIVNSILERPVSFSYREFTDPPTGKKFGVIIIPESSLKPHIVRNELFDDDSTVLLSRGECWIRTDGGKIKALAADYDGIYQDKIAMQTAAIIRAEKEIDENIKKRKLPKKMIDATRKIIEMNSEELNIYIRKVFE